MAFSPSSLGADSAAAPVKQFKRCLTIFSPGPSGGLLPPGPLRWAVPEDGGGPTCPHCDAELYERHCKYVCPQHGVIMDCADPFYFS